MFKNNSFHQSSSNSQLPVQPTDEQIRQQAFKVWKRRIASGKGGTSDGDWQRAIEELQLSPQEKWWAWTGIPEKNGWDLIISISIPLLIFLGGTLFTFANNWQQQKIADDRQRDEVLKNYISTMKELLLDKDRPLRQSKRGDESRHIARTLTLTTFRQLRNVRDKQLHDKPIDKRTIDDYNQRKGLVIQFLSESALVQEIEGNKDSPIISLDGADLRGADLRDTNLSGAQLYKTNLSGANLLSANLTGVKLTLTNLKGALFVGADLGGAKGWTDQQLSEAKLCNTSLPEGSKLDPDRDCKESGITP